MSLENIQNPETLDQEGGKAPDRAKKGFQEEAPGKSSSRISPFESYFWGTIFIFLAIFSIVSAIGFYNASKQKEQSAAKEPFMRIVIAPKMRENLHKNRERIERDLSDKESMVRKMVERHVEKIFEPACANVEQFLDYHYSVVGEYSELYHAATNDMDTLMKKRLFGENFDRHVENEFKLLQKDFEKLLHSHAATIESIAVQNVDRALNASLIGRIEEEIGKKIALNIGSLAVLIGGVKLGGKLVAKFGAKLVAKLGAKLGTKFGIKTASKTAAAGTGALSGFSCGPFAWICAPVLATVAWFGADAAIVSLDELLSRDSFRREVLSVLEEQKTKMKRTFEKELKRMLADFSNTTIREYERSSVKVKEYVNAEL